MIKGEWGHIAADVDSGGNQLLVCIGCAAAQDEPHAPDCRTAAIEAAWQQMREALEEMRATNYDDRIMPMHRLSDGTLIQAPRQRAYEKAVAAIAAAERLEKP